MDCPVHGSLSFQSRHVPPQAPPLLRRSWTAFRRAGAALAAFNAVGYGFYAVAAFLGWVPAAMAWGWPTIAGASIGAYAIARWLWR